MAIESMEQLKEELWELTDKLRDTLFDLKAALEEVEIIWEQFKDLHVQLVEFRSRQEA